MLDVEEAWTPTAGLVSRNAVAGCDDVLYVPEFMTLAQAQRGYRQIVCETYWVTESIRLFGREIPVPRRCAWFGDADVTYGYSRADHRAAGWSVATAALRERLLDYLGIRFNFVLLNLYRDGQDRMGWHADDEPELGTYPCIASLSFGAPRRFCLRARDGTERRAQLVLEPGSLLVMWGRSQQHWQHSLPRTSTPTEPRLNLTFRRVRTSP